MSLTMITALNSYAEQLVNLFTLGLLNSANSIYHHWLSGASTSSPSALAYLVAGFIVIIKFLVALIFVTILLRSVTKNIYVIIFCVSVFAALYTYFYFDPITLFKQVSQSTQNFICFLRSAASLKTKPFIFTFLDNALIVFVIDIVISLLGMWLFFALILGLVTLVIYIATAGKNPWEISNKNFKALTFQLALIFMIFYPILGALKAFITVFALLIGGTEIYAGIMTLRGYQKVCYNINNEVKCVWKK